MSRDTSEALANDGGFSHTAIRDYYDQLAATYDRSVVDWPGAVHRQTAALDDQLSRYLGPGPQRILDCAVGIGTQALGLAALGHHLHGVDISGAALRRAAAKANQAGLDIQLTHTDMRDVDRDVPGVFDAVICCDNSLSHLLTAHDLVTALGAMSRKMRAGGLMLASLRDYDRHIRVRPQATQPLVAQEGTIERVTFQRWAWIDDHCYVCSMFINERKSRGSWSTQIIEGALCRAWTRAEIALLATTAGAIDPQWLLPGASGYHQPMLVAHWG